MSEELELDLDPKKVLQAVQQIGSECKALADKIEEALGKDAAKSVKKFEDAAENGSNRVATMFRNLGTRIKEDLKTAFDVGMVLEGGKFAKDIASGTKQVFEMERAFDRLNTRLQLTGRQLNDFKRNVGSKIAGTGQKLEDVLPGVETAAAKGGVKSPGDLASIGEALGQAKAVTGEDTAHLSDTIVEILKSQGKEITGKSFKATLDALQGTRKAGAFATAGEAGSAVEELSPYAKKLGLDTRSLGGLAATASRAGSGGQDILRQLLEKGTTIGGQEQINSAFGTKLFKNGKLDANGFQNIKKDRFGKYSQQVMSEATGLTGSNGADLSRFIDSMKSGMKDFSEVTHGANETATQFGQATNNMASKFDQFKEKSKEAGREIVGSISAMGNDLLNGHVGEMLRHGKEGAGSLWRNKGTVAGALGLTAAVGILAGGSANSLFKKLGGGGAGKLAGGLIGGEAAKSAGITPVYVVNISEMNSGGGMFEKLGKLIPSASTAAGAVGGLSLGLVAATSMTAIGGANAVYEGWGKKPEEFDSRIKTDDRGNIVSNMMSREDVAAMTKAVSDGTVQANEKSKSRVTYTNPSSVTGTGVSK